MTKQRARYIREGRVPRWKRKAEQRFLKRWRRWIVAENIPVELARGLLYLHPPTLRRVIDARTAYQFRQYINRREEEMILNGSHESLVRGGVLIYGT